MVSQPVGLGRRPELDRGGLTFNLGGWSQVLSLRRKGPRMAADDRVLGDGAFVKKIWSESAELDKKTWRRRGPGMDLKGLAREIAVDQGITEKELRSGSRERKVSEARRSFCRASVGELGFPAAAVARFLGVTTSGGGASRQNRIIAKLVAHRIELFGKDLSFLEFGTEFPAAVKRGLYTIDRGLILKSLGRLSPDDSLYVGRFH
jgi:hypothetical protein